MGQLVACGPMEGQDGIGWHRAGRCPAPSFILSRPAHIPETRSEPSAVRGHVPWQSFQPPPPLWPGHQSDGNPKHIPPVQEGEGGEGGRPPTEAGTETPCLNLSSETTAAVNSRGDWRQDRGAVGTVTSLSPGHLTAVRLPVLRTREPLYASSHGARLMRPPPQRLSEDGCTRAPTRGQVWGRREFCCEHCQGVRLACVAHKRRLC